MPSNSDEFVRLVGPFRRDLLALCYQMLGSVHDAEDVVQETLMRAWRAYDDFDESRASIRTWLHRIATNACLTALENRARRPLPSGLTAASEHAGVPLQMTAERVDWLGPLPDALLGDPATLAASRHRVRLAFVAALQYLPPRQRAVLLMRDVLAFSASEVADLLGVSPTAVHSSLRRARAQIAARSPHEDGLPDPADPAVRSLLESYVKAFENADLAGLTRLLSDDAVLEMPPFLTWFTGAEAIVGHAAHTLGPGRPAHRWRLLPTAANRQPAVAAYVRADDGCFYAHTLQVLTVTGSAVTRIVGFQNSGLFSAFGLPDVLSGDQRSVRAA